MNWVETHGRKPRTGERLLFVRFRNGLESKQPYPARAWRFSHRGDNDDWDITHGRKAPEA